MCLGYDDGYKYETGRYILVPVPYQIWDYSQSWGRCGTVPTTTVWLQCLMNLQNIVLILKIF